MWHMATNMATAISLSTFRSRLPTWTCRTLAGFIASLGLGVAHGESWTFIPQVTAGETYSTNMALVGASPQSGWITDIAPGIRVDGAGSRVKAHLDYSRENLYYQGNSEWNRHQNLLNSLATIEAVDKWLFVDASANIVQRNLSVFGPVSVDQTNAAAKQVETRTTQVAPYIRGHVFNDAEYLLRINSIDAKSDDPTLVTTRVNQVVGSLKNLASAGAIGWLGDFSATNVKNDIVGSRDDTRFRGGLALSIGPRMHLSLSTGRETTNFNSSEKENTATPGVGLEWSPTPHTQVAALGEKRFFGTGHNLLLSHRTALTAWRYSDVKDVAILPTLLAGYNPGSISELMSDLLEASIPDPSERGREVRSRMDQIGAVANLPGGGGVQTSRFYLDRFQQASVALLGQRNTLTLLLSQRVQQLLSFAPDAVDSFSQFDTDIRERGASLAWLHRLTPVTNLNVSMARLKSEGLTTANLESNQTTATAAVTIRLTAKASASVGARRTKVDSTVSGSIRENALVGSLTQRF